jgi:hypothetical protein
LPQPLDKDGRAINEDNSQTFALACLNMRYGFSGNPLRYLIEIQDNLRSRSTTLTVWRGMTISPITRAERSSFAREGTVAGRDSDRSGDEFILVFARFALRFSFKVR